MTDRQATRQILRDLRRLLRAAQRLLECLSADEIRQRQQRIVEAVVAVVVKRLPGLPHKNMAAAMEKSVRAAQKSPDVLRVIEEMVRDVETTTKAAYKKARDPKPETRSATRPSSA